VKAECGKHLNESFAWICQPIDEAIKALEQEPKTGHWIYDKETDKAVCSECNGFCFADNLGRIETSFCPWCGADMSNAKKTGHWIEGQTNNPNVHNILCSCCFEGYPSKGHANSQYTREKFKYCPNCGAKMESEDKE
jgi:hypothetical protein